MTCESCDIQIDKRNKSGLCNSCYKEIRQLGKNNPNYKGQDKNKNCMDCNNEVYPGSERCKKCFHKWLGNNQKGENNPYWKGGLPKCLICGNQTNGWNNEYCSKKCFGISKTGINHHNYKGLTDLYTRIKNSFKYKAWRKQIFERDNYTCQHCKDNRGGNLEAHHNIKFSLMFKIFLNTYSQFSPIEDKETLVRLSESYEPFWNIDNGITLCIKCHKKTDNYGNNKQLMETRPKSIGVKL